MFQNTQDDKYLNLCKKRIISTEILKWVTQALDLLGEQPTTTKINDIGCNVGHFYKGIKSRNLNYDYKGYDIEERYLSIARSTFKDIVVEQIDICSTSPRLCDFTIISATLEHIPDYRSVLNRIFKTTNKKIILRTFLGETHKNDILKREGAIFPYQITQFSFESMLDYFSDNGFSPTIHKDEYTDSLPRYIGKGIVRTQYFIIGEKI